MWNMNDVYAANEHIEDIRRAAEKHNVIARMKAAGQTPEPDGQSGEQPVKQPVKQQQILWERVRNALR